MAISLLLADDEEIIRFGVKRMVEGTEIEVRGEAANGEELLSRAKEGTFDAALVDIRMPLLDGLGALQRLQVEASHLPVIVISAIDNPHYIARALSLGASGFILKEEPRERWLASIRAVASGGACWTREELRRVTGTSAMPRQLGDIDVPLTQREKEVLKLLASGLTNREIAQLLQISYETVKEHVQHILRKVGVVDRTQAAIWAVRNQLV